MPQLTHLNLVAFSTGVELWSPSLVRISAAAASSASRWLGAIKPDGQTHAWRERVARKILIMSPFKISAVPPL